MGPTDTAGSPIRQGFDRFYGYNCQRNAHSFYPPFLDDDEGEDSEDDESSGSEEESGKKNKGKKASKKSTKSASTSSGVETLSAFSDGRRRARITKLSKSERLKLIRSSHPELLPLLEHFRDGAIANLAEETEVLCDALLADPKGAEVRY